jgi:tight adherence protein C
MSRLLAGVCAAGAVLALAHRPPRPARLRRRTTSRPLPTLAATTERAGRCCRGAVGLRADPGRDRRAGTLLLVSVVAAFAGPQLAVVLGAAVALRTRWRGLRRAAGIEQAALERDLPDLVDLLALAVGAGLSVPAALPVVAPVAPASLRTELFRVVDAVAGGRPCDEAVVGLGARWGPPARPLVHALADHLRYGSAVLPALERVAVEARTRRRRAAETRARKLPVLLLFPLVLCILPAFGLLTVAPLVAGTFDSLRGGHLEAPASLGP